MTSARTAERPHEDDLVALEPIILDLLDILDPHVAAPMFRAVLAHGGHVRTIVVPEVDVDVVVLARFVARRLDGKETTATALEQRACEMSEEGR